VLLRELDSAYSQMVDRLKHSQQTQQLFTQLQSQHAPLVTSTLNVINKGLRKEIYSVYNYIHQFVHLMMGMN